MNVGVKIIAVALLSAYCFHLTTSVPLTSAEVQEIIKRLEDPCDLSELKEIPKCEASDKECDESNANKRAKRQTLCETNPNCSYCGELIPGDIENYDETVQPETIEPETLEPSIDNSEPEELRAPKRLIERNIVIENDNETQFYRGYVESAANITTIIRLTNLINNTNIVNMPTTLNNTNINNIHIYQNKTSDNGGKFGLGYTDQGPCCFTVGPKSCTRSTAGTKCRHKKTKVCGRQCTKKVIHPHKMPCVPQWPYMNCQPSQPPQGFYPPSYPGVYPPNYPGFYPQNPLIPDDFDDDDDVPLFPDIEELENPESGWLVGPEKCKVVSEDGLQITNCTNEGVEFDHPFAKNTVSEPIKRSARHANPQNQIASQQVPYYYPMMYQPVYMQPMPIYIPQYYAPPQQAMNYFGPQQIPLPPSADQETYYARNEDSNDINSFQKPRKRARKHHPIVMDIDEEL